MSITSTSVFLGCKAAAAELHKAGTRGSVVNVSSMYAIIGGTGTNAPYHGAFLLGSVCRGCAKG